MTRPVSDGLVSPQRAWPLLGLTLPPGDHARGLPAWLRQPSASLEGTLEGAAPRLGSRQGWAMGVMPCPALPLGVGIGGGHTRDPTRCCPLSWFGGLTLRGSRSLPELQAPGG